MKELLIPRIIHQIWFQGKENIPDKYQPYRSSWFKMHPTFQYHLWDEKKIRTLIEKNFSWYLKIWDNLPTMIQKIDSGKIFILLRYGGVIVDIDIEALKSIESLLVKPLVLSCCYVHPLGIVAAKMLGLHYFAKTRINNGFIAAAKEHPVINKTAELLRRTSTIQQEGEVYGVYIAKTCGPEVLSEALLSIDPNLTSCAIYPYEYCEPHVRFNGKPIITNNTHAIHHSERSWIKDSPVAQTQMDLLLTIIGVLITLLAIAMLVILWLAMRKKLSM